MIRFSKEKVLLLHRIMAQATGGSVGVRDECLLESALEAAFSEFGGVAFYPTKEEKACWTGSKSIGADGQRAENGDFSALLILLCDFITNNPLT